MSNTISNRSRLIFATMALLFSLQAAQLTAHCQQLAETDRLNELARLRDELRLSDSLRNEDLVLVIGERTITEAARLLVGLEILMANGGLLRVTSVDVELKPAAAIVRIDAQAKSSVTVDLSLTGRLGTGEIKDDVFQLPFEITEVSLTNSPITSLFIKTFLGEWLSPRKWNEELPALEIPLEITKPIQVPASRFNVEGSPPMEISTPAYQHLLRFVLRSLFVLDKRMVLGLHMGQNPNVYASIGAFAISGDDKIAALEGEVARLSEKLTCDGDLRVRLNRRVISRALAQVAAAQQNDFTILLKPGRVRAEEVNALVKVLNYTDIEGGNGSADLSQLSIESIGDGKVILKLSGQGEIDAQLRGREYGMPYRLSPHTTFSIKDRIVPLQLVSEGERIMLRALPGTSLPIDLRFSIKIAQREIGINRSMLLQMDRWLNRIEIPSFFGSEISLPRKLEVDAGGNLYVTSQEKIVFKLSKIRIGTADDAVDLSADVIFSRH